jgi:hypothetical protein
VARARERRHRSLGQSRAAAHRPAASSRTAGRTGPAPTAARRIVPERVRRLRWTPSDTFRIDARARLCQAGPDQLPERHGRVRCHQSGVPFLSFFNTFVAPPDSCCTANSDIDKSGVPEGLLPHDDLEAWGATWFNTWQFGDGLTLKSITALPRHGALVRSRRRQLGARLQRRRPRRGPGPVQPGAAAREPGQRHVQLDRSAPIISARRRTTRRVS